MKLRATNAALKGTRDEVAILANFSGILFHHETGQIPQPLTQVQRWREMTEWVAKDGVLIIFNEEAKHIAMGVNRCLAETLADIGALAALEEDWNDEGAPAIDRAAILRARSFVQHLACFAAEQNLAGECALSVFPAIDGGVKVSWQADGHQVALVFRPERPLIEIIEKLQGEPTLRRFVSETEAADIAIRAMQEAL